MAYRFLLLALVITTLPAPAHAFSTRVHIVLSNDVREALIASGDGSIQLAWSGDSVVLSSEDADAIVNQPLAFRAGAIGPDNFVFPGMTDATHALGQNPFEMCELLYLDSVTEQERAYALGCFLHGTTDAIAHHFVNYFTGETFTLTPLSASRGSSFSNVVGHIVTEAEIQKAFFRADPSDFGAGPLSLDLPNGFVSRNFHDTESRLWQQMMTETTDKLDRTRAGMPDADLLSVVSATELGPWEQVGLAPMYVEELQRLRAGLRDWVLAEIADMQDPGSTRGMELLVGVGPDGTLGTADDTTACDFSCPTIFGRYKVFTNLLLPRMDAGGRELPSAFDTISDDLGRQLDLFLPALLQTIENLAVILNAPLASEDDSGFELSRATIDDAIRPMRDWVDAVLAIDYDLIADAITPAWYMRLEDLFASVGVDIRIGSLLEVIFQPTIDMVRTLIEDRVIAAGQVYLEDLSDEISATRGEWLTRIEAQLDASAPTTTPGHALDDVRSSGLNAYAFNLVSATLANHDLVLSTDEVANGPASFDSSYTHHWTQAGLCDYLRPSIFPEGTSVGAILSIRTDEMFHPAGASEDSPVECHDGSLMMFGEPSTSSCMVTTLDALFDDPTGSLSRSYPPMWAAIMPRCLNISVPGLPDPPPDPVDGGVDPDGGTSDDASTGADGGMMMDGDGGCGCVVPGGDPGGPGGEGAGWLMVLLGVVAIRRRRGRAQRTRHAWLAALLALTVACGDDDGGMDAGADADIPDSTTDTGFDAGPDASMDGAMDDAGGDAGDAGPDLRRELLDALGSSVWNASLERSEGVSLVERAYEMRFNAGSLEWAEIRNPFGPARMRTLRSFSVMADGRTIESIILSPDGWPPHPRNGLRQTWDLEIIDGDPRVLRLTEMDSGVTEELTEGAWPEPTEGLTAEIRVFGPSGAAWEAFCGAGPTLDDSERQVLWSFARGESAIADVGYDVAAGVPLRTWDDSAPGANDFAVTDVHGFDRLGGTLLDDQFNFIVRYTGTIAHPGGSFAMREQDDDVEDAVWAFADDGVGSSRVMDLLLEVHNWINSDATPNEPSEDIAAGDVPIEIMLVRCSMPFDGQEARVEMNLGGGGWMLVGDQPSAPVIDDMLFPPAL